MSSRAATRRVSFAMSVLMHRGYAFATVRSHEVVVSAERSGDQLSVPRAGRVVRVALRRLYVAAPDTDASARFVNYWRETGAHFRDPQLSASSPVAGKRRYSASAGARPLQARLVLKRRDCWLSRDPNLDSESLIHVSGCERWLAALKLAQRRCDFAARKSLGRQTGGQVLNGRRVGLPHEGGEHFALLCREARHACRR